MKLSRLLTSAAIAAAPLFAHAAPAGEPIITFHSDAYSQVGEGNEFSFLFGVTEPGEYYIRCGAGERYVTFTEANVEDGAWQGTWVPLSVDAGGLIEIWGDPSKMDVILADGGYIQTVDMPQCTNLSVLSLEHNAMQSLDLTPFTNLYALYLSDNPFDISPVVIGAPKPHLTILEVDIIDNFDPAFNLSAYPAMQFFDAYHNRSIQSIDPTGCPELVVLSAEMTDITTLDVTQNPKLKRLNISESRVTEINLSQNPLLEHFLATHVSGWINKGYRLESVDLTNNPKLQILHLGGNLLGSIDLSQNPLLTNVTLDRNALTSLDISSNTALYSLNVFYNDMDFATLPLPQPAWGEYFYRQNDMKVARSIQAGTVLDLSSRVLREGTVTDAIVWTDPYNTDPQPLDPALWQYADGKVTFNTALPDSVYVEYTNSVFTEYAMRTTPFMVKDASDFGQPTKILTMTPMSYDGLKFRVGMYGASPETPKTFTVDFGDGQLKQFTVTDALQPAELASGVPGGQVSVYIPEGEVMTSFYIDGYELAGIDLSKATELQRLQIANTGIYAVDLKYNRALEWLDLTGNNLYTLDLSGIYGDYEKTVLHTLLAPGNHISSFTTVTQRAFGTIDLSGNDLTEFPLNDFDNLRILNLSDNKLEGNFDMAYFVSGQDIDLSGNLLTSVTLCPENTPASADFSSNLFGIATLPLPSQMGASYTYAPQKPVQIPAKSYMVDLSAQNVSAAGQTSQYAWFADTDDGPVQLTEGEDYTVSGGITRFTSPIADPVSGQITNPSFPALTLTTTATEVQSMPRYLVAEFTSGTPNPDAVLIIRGTETNQLYIDWNSTDNLEPYEFNEGVTRYPMPVSAGGTTRVYAQSETDMADLSVFSIYDQPLQQGDFSKLTSLTTFALGGTGLAPEDLVMPQAPGLWELSLNGNRFDNYPYAANYPSLNWLQLADNLFTEFDASAIPSLGNLTMANNQLTSITFNNPELWNIDLTGNFFETFDFTGLPKIEQVFLNSNQLTAIDPEPARSTLKVLAVVANRLTLATLPVPSDWTSLNVYYYGNQAAIDVTPVDGTIDLSDQAYVKGTPTEFMWYDGIPEYNEETGELEGNLLQEGSDYTIEGGVTTFLRSFREAICIFGNAELPNATMMTCPVNINVAGIEGVAEGGLTEVWNMQGVLLRRAPASEVLEGLEPGLYIVNGRKVLLNGNN